LLLAKILEQVERTEHLLNFIPDERIDWKPDFPGRPNTRSIGELLGHLLDCLAGVCAVLCAADPQSLAHFASLRDQPVNHCCGVSEARERIAGYRSCIEQGFAVLPDRELARPIPTIFVPEGEPLLTLLLGNLEHFINHKHELFLYLKLLGAPVSTADLYHWRGKR